MEEQPLVLLRSSDYIAMNPHAREKFWRYNFATQVGLEWSGAGCLAENTGLGSRGPKLAHVEGTAGVAAGCAQAWAAGLAA
ncbi:hypothetical protein TIFTF001_033484 [Ficus carica]|uniref:Uncharacterized protein n=1 Tax=Ficus carica TaxID=3494 RepID=A0AA88DYK8_FICCA|nr:hypothetical protein TIFTF001_033484 [Ficus carica]